MSVESELLALKDGEGLIHPRDVVDWASGHKRSDLYKQFTWDDAKAADEYRLWEARRLIKIHIVSDEGEPQVVSLSIDRKEGGGYRDIGDVTKSRDLSEIMLQDALDELQRVRARYARVKELVSVWSEVDKVRASRKPPQKEKRPVAASAA